MNGAPTTSPPGGLLFVSDSARQGNPFREGRPPGALHPGQVRRRDILPAREGYPPRRLRVYQPCVIALTEQLTEWMIYRSVRQELGKVVEGVPSPRTSNPWVIEGETHLNEAICQWEMYTWTINPDGRSCTRRTGSSKTWKSRSPPPAYGLA